MQHAAKRNVLVRVVTGGRSDDYDAHTIVPLENIWFIAPHKLTYFLPGVGGSEGLSQSRISQTNQSVSPPGKHATEKPRTSWWVETY